MLPVLVSFARVACCVIVLAPGLRRCAPMFLAFVTYLHATYRFSRCALSCCVLACCSCEFEATSCVFGPLAVILLVHACAIVLIIFLCTVSVCAPVVCQVSFGCVVWTKHLVVNVLFDVRFSCISVRLFICRLNCGKEVSLTCACCVVVLCPFVSRWVLQHSVFEFRLLPVIECVLFPFCFTQMIWLLCPHSFWMDCFHILCVLCLIARFKSCSSIGSCILVVIVIGCPALLSVGCSLVFCELCRLSLPCNRVSAVKVSFSVFHLLFWPCHNPQRICCN